MSVLRLYRGSIAVVRKYPILAYMSHHLTAVRAAAMLE